MHSTLLLALCGSLLVNATPSHPSGPADFAGGPASLPPKYLGVKDFRKCLQTCPNGSFCLPDSKPTECCDESWKKICDFNGSDRVPPCEKPVIPMPPPMPTKERPQSLPPKYLRVKDFDKCLQTCPSGWCKPDKKPTECCDESWNELCGLTENDRVPPCEKPTIPMPIPRPLPIPSGERPHSLPPKYLKVKDFDKCLQTCPGGWCKPDQKPAQCCDESWNELCGFTGNDRVPPCERPDIPIPIPRPLPIPSGERPHSLPPKYLKVKDFNKCLQTCPSGFCIPDKKPTECCDESWNELCGFTGNDKIPTCEKPVIVGKPESLPPKYLTVKDFRKCVNNHRSGGANSFCLPDNKLKECSDDSWKQLCSFTGGDKLNPCPKPMPQPIHPPKYLSVKDFKKCLNTCPSGWCKPDQKPIDCCEDSWKELCGFSGDDRVPPCNKN